MRRKMKDETENSDPDILPDSLGWDAMIRDAKKRIKDLELLIRLLEKRKAAGERWPGEQAQDQDAAQREAVRRLLQFPSS